MDQFDFYNEVAISFPAIWPKSPEWTWVNVHDGQRPIMSVLSELVGSTINSLEVIVVVHSDPGAAARLPIDRAVDFLSKFILVHEIQVSDLQFTRLVSVSREGIATCDA